MTRARRRWGCGAREERRSRVSSAHGMLQRDLVDYVGARGVCWVRDGRAPSDRTDWTPTTRANAMANNPGRFMTTERRITECASGVSLNRVSFPLVYKTA